MYSGTSLLRLLSGLGQSDLNSEMTVLVGLYFTVMEIVWDCPRVTIIARWLCYRGDCKARFDCIATHLIGCSGNWAKVQ